MREAGSSWREEAVSFTSSWRLINSDWRTDVGSKCWIIKDQLSKWLTWAVGQCSNPHRWAVVCDDTVKFFIALSFCTATSVLWDFSTCIRDPSLHGAQHQSFWSVRPNFGSESFCDKIPENEGFPWLLPHKETTLLQSCAAPCLWCLNVAMLLSNLLNSPIQNPECGRKSNKAIK